MTVKILQWNVWYKEDPSKLADFLVEVGADILCLQEMTTTSPDNPLVDVPELLARRLGFYKCYFEAQRWVSRGVLLRTQGNAILSRYPVARPRLVFVQESQGPEPPYDGEGRVYGETEVDLGESWLTVATAHLSYVRSFGVAPFQERECERLMGAIGQERERYVFAGDLNSLPGSELVRELPERTGLVHAGPDYAVKTWTTKPHSPFSAGGSPQEGLDWRLDYVFASPDVRVVRSEVLETDLSDHLPILVTVEV
jgi:endonuclease/exonuclease/phosphatase family metal-dependent hydrolase